MVNNLAVFRLIAVFLSLVFGLKMQISTVLEKKKRFWSICDRFEVQVVTVWYSRLGKTQNSCIFAYGRFLRTFKITHFFRFLKDF